MIVNILFFVNNIVFCEKIVFCETCRGHSIVYQRERSSFIAVI